MSAPVKWQKVCKYAWVCPFDVFLTCQCWQGEINFFFFQGSRAFHRKYALLPRPLFCILIVPCARKTDCLLIDTIKEDNPVKDDYSDAS